MGLSLFIDNFCNFEGNYKNMLLWNSFNYLSVSHSNTVISHLWTCWLFPKYLHWISLPWKWNFCVSLAENELMHLSLWTLFWEGLMIFIFLTYFMANLMNISWFRSLGRCTGVGQLCRKKKFIITEHWPWTWCKHSNFIDEESEVQRRWDISPITSK